MPEVLDEPGLGPPDWSAVPDAPGHPALIAGAYAAAGLAIAALLWATGHRVPAAVLVALVLAGGLVSVLSPRAAAAIDRLRAGIQRVAGRILAYVTLTVVQLLVFFPASLVLRLLRKDPLALPPGDPASFWRPVSPPGERPLPRRQFTYEPGRAAGAGGPGRRRVRAALGAAALLVILDLAFGAVLHRLDHTGDAERPGARQSLLFFPHIAASRGESFLPALAAEIDHVWYARHYDAFLGWAMPDTFRGRWLNITRGVRRSYEPTRGRGRTIDVDFMGGSTMFGLFERDGHTIPSEVARFAERDGIRLHPVNLGRMAYNNWQETLLLSERTAAGDRPDLTVFYDGNNELVGQFRLGPHVEPEHQEAQEYARRIGFEVNGSAPPASGSSPVHDLLHAWKGLSGITWLYRRFRGEPTEKRTVAQPLTSSWIADQRGHARAAGRGAAAVYRSGVNLGRSLGRADGFPTVFFWQPILYSKPIRPGERQAVGALGTDPQAWTEADRVARSHLPAGVFDISDVLDRERAPVMYDFVHTNETGARVIARAIYARLRPTLLRLRAEAPR